jgi:hypothetical protein
MRVFVVSAALALLMAPLAALGGTAPKQVASAGTSLKGLAPADEYFGRFAQSVLEVRNRMAAIDLKTDAEMQTADEIGAIDHVEDAVIAWQKKYPADPWVSRVMSRLVASYARAGAAGSSQATEVLTSLTSAYPKSSDADRAILALWETPAAAATRVTGEVVAAATGAPVPDAIVLVAPNHESSDLASTPFGTTGSDGMFAVANVPFAPAEYIVVEPPRGSAYAVYHGTIGGSAGKDAAGVIRLAAR